MHEHYDVIIIGAGLAGLSAAKVLNEKGVNFKIIEAASRAGGKVLSSERMDRYFELGAQFVNEDMTEMTGLIKAAGMEIKRTDITENSVEIDEITKKAVDRFLNDIQKELNAEMKAKDERLSNLYEKRIKDNHLIKIIRSYHSELLNINPKYLSSKAVVDSSERYLSKKSDLTHQASGPLSNLILYLEGISQDRIVYNEPVKEVFETDKGYSVRSVKNEYKANAVIVAIPPTAASRIVYSPNLKSHFQEALNSYTDGAIIKITWVYEKAFWHRYLVEEKVKRLKGVIYTNPEGIAVVDSSKAEEESRLTMFIGADIAKMLAKRDKAQRLEFALRLLIDVFGEKARNYVDAEERIWVEDPYCGGGYSAKIHYGGLYNAADLLREAYHKLIFSSSEIAHSFPHFMEGAVRSGKYAANCILEAIDGR
ncbi:flavin monoamine oxidase family protein [Cytobacillus sp. FJAT-53684]|uniref:Flavin monoamine oxidase family protein n=1 Tax=Cytobacillus mangrovibacter TaxID=3299024 RepID=A0ABW6K358_9BACI